MKPLNKKKGRAVQGRAEDINLKAPQSVIHIKHTITLRQYKYWFLMLGAFREAHEQNQPPDAKGFYRFPIAKLTEHLGYEPVKDELKTDFEALRREPININILNKDGKPVQQGMGFISEWEITSKTVGFKIPSFIEEVMRGLDEPRSIFQLINWNIFNKFSGKYEAVIYKLCRDYIGVGRTPYMTLQEYRDYMGLNETDYSENKELNRWVIAGPINKINESPITDILVTPEIERKGRSLTGLHFLVAPKNKALPPAEESSLEAHPAFHLAKVPILPETQKKYLALRGEAEIALCVERANEYGERQAQDGKPPNYGALYHTAIKEGWHTVLTDKKTAEAATRDRKKAESAARRRTAAELKARAEKGLADSEAVLTRFRALPEPVQAEFITAFLATDASAKSAYRRKGFDSPLFLFPFTQYLKGHAA